MEILSFGRPVERVTPEGDGWRYVNGADETETYDAAGRLLSIADRTGLKQMLAYSDGTQNGATGGVVLDDNGNPLTLPLPAGKLIRVTDPFGRVLSFGYDSAGRVKLVLDPAGNRTLYGYDANGNLTSVRRSDGSTRKYIYAEQENTSGVNQPNALTGITDENGVRFATFKYDRQGRAISTEHSGGAGRVTLAYGNGSTDVTDAFGQVRKYRLANVQGAMRTTAIEGRPCPSCGPAALTYDANGNVASSTDWNGNKTCYAYDLARNLETRRVEGLPGSTDCAVLLGQSSPSLPTGARLISTEWHETWRLPVRITEAKRVTTYRYNGDGGANCGTRADGNLVPGVLCERTEQALESGSDRDTDARPVDPIRTWRYTYNENGLVLTAQGPRTDANDTTTYTYYADDDPDTGRRGNIATLTNALGQSTAITAYDSHGRPTAMTDPNGLAITLAYDARGRLASRTVGTDTTGYRYDGVGQLTRATLPDGSFIAYTYDAAQRLIGIADNLGNRIAYTLDAMGNRLREDTFDSSGALVTTRSRVYNTLNRLEQEIGGSDPARQITRYGYDNQGNLTSIDGPLAGSPNDLTQLAYDALNRLKQVTDALGGATRFGYDGLDQLASVTDPRNLTTRYTTSGLGTTSVQVSPDTGTTTRTFDAAGNLVRETDARRITLSYSYDALNRLRTIRYEPFDGRRAMRAGRRLLADFKYDTGENARGRLSRMTDPSGVTEYAYDARGRRSQKRQTQGAVAHVVGYGFDAADRLDRITYPSGAEVHYTRDASGRVSGVEVNGQPLLTGVEYHPFGPPKSWAWGNGTPYRRTIDRDGRITSYPVSATTSWSLTYDAAGRIAGIAKGSSTQALAYNVLDRLTASVEGTANYGYTYDANGNRTASTFGAATSVHTIDTKSNRLTVVSDLDLTQRYSYSAAGNVTSDSLRVYSYDERNRLVRAARGAVATTYSYNGIGERVRKAGEQGTVYFVYDEGGRLLGEYSGQSSIETIYLGDQPVAVMAGGALYHVYADHLGTPRGITDIENRPRWRWDSTEPFGASFADEDPSGLGAFVYNLRFPGQYYDRETGLHYNYFRDYDPQIGRYIESDPIGMNGGFNLYEYVKSNPITRLDPMGLDSAPAYHYSTDPLDYIPKHQRNWYDFDQGYRYKKRVTPADDEKIKQYICDLWYKSQKDGSLGPWELAHNQRKKDPYNLSLRNAEHYYWSYTDTETRGELPSIINVYLWEAVKIMRWYDPFSLWPTTPPSTNSIKWGMQGVDDAVRYGSKKAPPFCRCN